MNLRARLLFLLFTNNTENEHFICSFNQSTTLSVLTTCLSAQAFIINSPLRFSTRHICTSVLCNIFKHLHCCHVALHWFSLVWGFWFWFFCWVFFFWHLLAFFLGELPWIFYLGLPKPQIYWLLMLTLKLFVLKYHFIFLCLWPFHLY